MTETTQNPTKTYKVARKTQKVSFFLGKEYLKEFVFEDLEDRRHAPIQIYHAYPRLADWQAKTISDEVNPRSHGEDCLKSHVSKAIKETLLDRPADFFLANRGSTIIAHDLNFDPKTGIAELTISDLENQGLADGATTDAVIASVQKELLGNKKLDDIPEDEKPEALKNARLHLEIIVGLKDRERIGELVSGRNTSRQVRSWSLADFKGAFDPLKDVLERPDSIFKGKVGYEENSPQDVNILEIVSVLTLFHPYFEEKGEPKAPTAAYTSKGKMDILLTKEEYREGYEALYPLTSDILKLRDYIYANFGKRYVEAFGPRAKLGRRFGVETRKTTDPHVLPLTGTKSDYIIPNGLIFPLLASFRVLIDFKNGSWKTNPFEFFDNHGAQLIRALIDQLEFVGHNPNTAGKKKQIYINLHQTARLILADDQAKLQS